MTGSVKHLGGDRWQVRVYVGRRDGKDLLRSKTITAKGERAARRAADDIASDLRRARQQREKDAAYVNGLIDEWLEVKASKAASTLYRERSIIERIRKHLGHIRLDELGARDIERFYSWLRTTKFKGHGQHTARPLSESTVHHHHRVLHAILASGERWDLVPAAQTRKVEKPTRGRPKVRPPSPEQIWEAINRSSKQWQTVFAFAAKTGMRRGEICALHWTDLHDDGVWVRGAITGAGGKLADKQTKTDVERYVELSPTAVAALHDWRRHLEQSAIAANTALSPKARMFPDIAVDPTGRTPLNPDAVSQAWVRACTVNGQRVITARFHDLRHFAASHLIREGVDIKRVSDQLGHAQTSTTLNVYTAAVGSSRIAEAMDRALPAPPVSS